MANQKTVWSLSIGVLNINSGKTIHDWNFYEVNEERNNEAELYLINNNFLLWGAENSLEIGDKVVIRNNDTRRKQNDGTVTAILPVQKEALIEALYEREFDYKPKMAFKASRWKNKLQTSFSIKGVEIGYEK